MVLLELRRIVNRNRLCLCINDLLTMMIYTRYYLFSPLYRQCHFALADESGTARCHYLTPIDKFIDKFS